MAEESAELVRIGSITVSLYLDGSGGGLGYELDGISRREAIGHLIVALDRMREEEKFGWETCPGCDEPWDDHEDEDD